MTGRLYSGVDGCPAGWVEVRWSGTADDTPTAHLHRDFAAIIAGPATMIAVDMPIGLPKVATTGGRTCDRLARARLGERQSAVFAVPSRAAIACTDYRSACEANLAHSWPPRKVSKQCFFLFDKIREIDALVTPGLQARLHEVHPELSFWAMNGQRPLSLPKKIKSRPNREGLEQRRALLKGAGFPIDRLAPPAWPASVAGPDDVLDACACCWSARRLGQGEASHFPPEPEYDQHGLVMEIAA